MTEKIHSLIFVVADNMEVSTLLREDTDYFLYMIKGVYKNVETDLDKNY